MMFVVCSAFCQGDWMSNPTLPDSKIRGGESLKYFFCSHARFRCSPDSLSAASLFWAWPGVENRLAARAAGKLRCHVAGN